MTLPTHARDQPISINQNVDENRKCFFTSGCPPMSDRVGQCRYCLKVVGVTEKCGVCRWDFAKISFHSRDPVFFRFTVRHPEFRIIQASDNVGNGTDDSGVVAAGISFLCGLELEIWVGVILPPLGHGI